MSDSRPRKIARFVLALVYMAAGLAHLLNPAPFLAITPAWVPQPELVILATGVAELLGAAGLLTRRFRHAAGIGLALYALCVYPANLNHALNGIAVGGETLGWGYHAPRLLFQPLFIWWALWAGGVIEWPFGRKERAVAK
ncbi:MAG: hypothetical protein AAF205_07080 [Pseudomonadota bacterium]